MVITMVYKVLSDHTGTDWERETKTNKQNKK